MPHPVVDSLNQNNLVAFTQQLVRIPSINPPGGEEPVADLVAQHLKNLGLDVQTYYSAPGRANVVARLKGTGGGKSLLLNGHLDVLPPGNGWTMDPFSAEIVDGRLYGRGSLDMKAGIAAMVFVADTLVRSGTRLRGDLLITAVADEVEGGYKGTGYLVAQGLLKADYAVVCEPTGPDVYVAHRGALWLELTVKGRSAHGGRPWMGVNAISKVAKVVRAVEEELLPFLKDRTHWIVPSPTITIGIVDGGGKYNLVADRCRVTFDRRLVMGESLDQAEQEFRELIARVRAADDQEWQWELKRVMSLPPYEIDRNADIVRFCQKACGEVTGHDAGISATAGFEDAHFLASAGIETAMFGPYRKRNPPQSPLNTLSGGSEEHVEVEELIRGAQILTQLALNICG